MKTEYPLDLLIRYRYPINERINYKKEKIVHILERTGEIISHRGLNTVGRKVKSYVVSKENTAEHQMEYVVADVPNNRRITLVIKYRIRCLKKEDSNESNRVGKKFLDFITKPLRTTLLSFHINLEHGNEDKIVQALYKDTHPALTLHKRIMRWIREYKEKDGDEAFILNFFSIRDELKKMLVEKTAREIGAKFMPRIRLKYEKEWDPIKIISDNFPVYVQGCDDAINIKFQTELYRDLEPDRRIYALARHHHLGKVESRMPGVIASFMNHNCILHEFFFKPRFYLRDKIIKHLNENFLRREGRHITSLTLTTTFDFDPPNPQITEDFEVELPVEGEHDNISITYRMVLLIQDLDKFRTFKFPDFLGWFKDRLIYVTKKNFNSKTYTEHLIEFTSHRQDIEKSLKEQMSFWAELVGYQLQKLYIITDLEKLRYKEGYRFEIEANNVEYATNNNRIKVNVDLIIQGSLTNMLKVKKDVSWKFKNDVEAALKEYLLERLKYKIKATKPERFYSHIFDYEAREGGIEIIKKLREEMAAILDRWETTNIKVEIKLLEINAVKRIKLLRQNTHDFEVTVFPYRSEGYGEKVFFDGKFIIIGIAEKYWSVFTARNYEKYSDEINAISGYLKNRISRDLNKISIQLLQKSNREDIPQIKKITTETLENVERVFGVTAKLVHFNRRPMLTEEVAFKQQQVLSRISALVNGFKKNIFNGKREES
jgi:hypothetical protein